MVDRYVPEWERLAQAAEHVAVSGRLTMMAAKIDLCRAISDRKIQPRVFIEAVKGEYGSGMVGTVQRKGFQIPTDLKPSDFDWERSRPLKLWRAFRPTPDSELVHWQIGWIEVFRDDVSRVLCGAKKHQLHAIPNRTKRRRKGSPCRELARTVLNEVYPTGPPATESNKMLILKVRGKLKKDQKISDATILRAAGRRK